MALNASGPISLAGATAGQSIALELGLSTTGQISLNDAAVRTLAGVPSGAIVMPTNFYGKSNRAAISHTFTSSTANASLNVSSIGGYSAGTSDITVTVNSGVYLYATSTGGYGLNLTGGTTGDTVTLVNNGFIIGQGGLGGPGAGSTPSAGGPGGPALNVGIGVNITINNTNASAYIGGGGGGGGSGGNAGAAGGGAGGGAGGSSTYSGSGAAGGAGGGIGASGGNGVAATVQVFCCSITFYSAGGGGRILPGTGGAGGISSSIPGKGGGSGGGGVWRNGANGGAGGSANAAGGAGTGTSGLRSGGGGGGWGASGGTSDRAGGAGGKAVNLNGKSVTWVSGNTTRVYGAVS